MNTTPVERGKPDSEGEGLTKKSNGAYLEDHPI